MTKESTREKLVARISLFSFNYRYFILFAWAEKIRENEMFIHFKAKNSKNGKLTKVMKTFINYFVSETDRKTHKKKSF